MADAGTLSTDSATSHREACVNFMTVLAAAQRAFDAKQFDVAAGKLRAAQAVVARVAVASR